MDNERIERFETVGSTNAIALERARRGEAGGLWIVAERQESGRGRMGRPWISDAGNLYSSLLLERPGSPERLGELPLVIAVALHEAVTEVLPPFVRSGLSIKWPNDLLLNGGKLSGILLEGTQGPHGSYVVVGIGVNCLHAPPAGTALYPSTSLASAGFPVEPDALFERLRHQLRARLDQWRAEGFSPIRKAWLDRAAGIGQRITVRLPNASREGLFDGLDADGRLLLRGDDGRVESISAGDVFLGLWQSVEK